MIEKTSLKAQILENIFFPEIQKLHEQYGQKSLFLFFLFFFHRLLRSIQCALIQDATSCDCGEAQTALTYTGCLYTALCLISFGSLQNSKSTWTHSKSHFRCARHKYLLHKQKCFPLTGAKIFCSAFYSSMQSTSISTKKQVG